MVTGATIAVAVRTPELVIPLAFASHFILDVLPHFGVDRDIFKRNASKLFQIVMGLDIIGMILALVFLPMLATTVAAWLVLLAMLVAASPDAVWVYRFFKEIKTRKIAKLNWFNTFHSKIQWGERPWGIIIEIIYLGGALLIFGKYR